MPISFEGPNGQRITLKSSNPDGLGHVLEVSSSGSSGSAPSGVEDAAAGSGFTGSPVLAVRQDSNASLVDASGDFAPLQVDSLGRLRATLPDSFPLTGAAAQSTANNDLLTGTSNGWYDVIAWQSGVVEIVGSAGISAGAVIFEQTNDNTQTAGVAIPVQEVQVQNSNPLVAAITIGASTRRIFRFGITGRYLRVRISTGFTGGTVQAFALFSLQPFSTPTINVQQSTSGNLVTQSVGAAAQGATASGSPVFTGGVAKTAQPTARTDGQIVAPLFDKVGRMIVGSGSHIRDLRDTNAMVTITGTAETTIVSAVASTFNDLEAFFIANSSATGVRVDIRDTTGGTVRLSIWVPATTTYTYTGPTLKQSTVNTNWTATVSSAVTDIRITALTARHI